MTEYAVWDAQEGREVSKRYTNLDELRKSVYNKVVRNGKRKWVYKYGYLDSRYEVVSINKTRGVWPYTGRGELYSVGKRVYYIIWKNGNPTETVRRVLPDGTLSKKLR